MVDRIGSSNNQQFVAAISHEFRIPMTVISGFIQSVLNRSQDNLRVNSSIVGNCECRNPQVESYVE